MRVMCLAIPGKILKVDSQQNAEVDFDGLIQKASLTLVPKAKVGDYVLVHAGYAIEVMNKAEAQKSLDLLKEMQ